MSSVTQQRDRASGPDTPARPDAVRADTGAPPTPEQLGVGMRFSVHPHCDDYVDVILGALADAEAAGHTQGLVLDTDAVATYVGAREQPAEERLVAYLAAVVAAAHRRSGHGHVVAHVLLSRGCPGEVGCDLTATGLPAAAPVTAKPTGIPATAQWSLYPLLDGGDTGAHLAHIEAASARARRRGVLVTPTHYATILSGDLAEVLAVAADAWAATGSQVAHVVTHLTVSVGSPTRARR